MQKAFARRGWLGSSATPRRSVAQSPAGVVAAKRRRPVGAGAAESHRPWSTWSSAARPDPDDERRALGVLSTAPRRRQLQPALPRVRELRGLAYSVYSFAQPVRRLRPRRRRRRLPAARTEEVLAVVRDQLTTIAADASLRMSSAAKASSWR